ncbi:MAG: hypothetical protein J1F69_02180 [Clostridiales bacterium]|nr:hypothetical protein [Clostridiales bacterium]
MDNKTMLLILMIVLIAFIVLLAILGIVFIIALRKRAPVVKVVMAPRPDEKKQEDEPVTASAATATEEATVTEKESKPKAEPSPEPEPEPEVEPDIDEDDEEDDEDTPQYVTEGSERVRYNRSMTAKVAQLPREAKEWYSELKNELLSYEKVKDRMSWKRETFRMGRMAVARLVVRGKSLRLLVAVEPAGYNGTKYAVEDVSNVASTADTPTMYRIKNPRRVKYAKEMIAGMMKELKVFKDSHYVAQDFFLPYEGDLAFMRRGLVKRIVTGTTRTFKIEEVDNLDKPATDNGAGGNA